MNTSLTTVDNPYHPIAQFDEWYAFDTAHHYHTLAYLDRVNSEFSKLEQYIDLTEDQLFDECVKFIVEQDVGSMYKIVQ